jgi:hypothetical protein
LVVVMRLVHVLEAKLTVGRVQMRERVMVMRVLVCGRQMAPLVALPGETVMGHVRVPMGMVHRLVMMGRELVPFTLLSLGPRPDRTFGLVRQLLKDRSDTVGFGHVDLPFE